MPLGQVVQQSCEVVGDNVAFPSATPSTGCNSHGRSLSSWCSGYRFREQYSAGGAVAERDDQHPGDRQPLSASLEV